MIAATPARRAARPAAARAGRPCGVALAAWAAGCTLPATEVVVRLDTDVPTARPLTIVARLVAASGASASQQWVRGDGLDAGIALPGTLALVPGASAPRDTTATLTIDATLAAASSDAPALSIHRVARFAFTPRTTTYLPIFLALSCTDEASGCSSVPDDRCTVSTWCDDHGATCGDRGTCVPVALEPVVPDAGVADAAAPTDDAPQPATSGYCLATPALAAAPVIDGVLDQTLPLQPLPLAVFSAASADAVTAEAAVAWRPDGLYFFVRVHEATRTPAPASATPDLYWCGDAVELFVDPVTTGLDTAFGGSARQFMLPAPSDDGAPGTRCDRRQVPLQNQPWTGAFGTFPTADGYVAEAFLVARDLDQATWALGPATPAAIDIQVDTAGATAGRAGGTACDADPAISAYAQLTLHNPATCPTPCNPSAWTGGYCTPVFAAP